MASSIINFYDEMNINKCTIKNPKGTCNMNYKQMRYRDNSCAEY
jgi:hypothetical protein